MCGYYGHVVKSFFDMVPDRNVKCSTHGYTHYRDEVVVNVKDVEAVYLYHGHEIAKYRRLLYDELMISNAGYPTATTRDRLSAIVAEGYRRGVCKRYWVRLRYPQDLGIMYIGRDDLPYTMIIDSGWYELVSDSTYGVYLATVKKHVFGFELVALPRTQRFDRKFVLMHHYIPYSLGRVAEFFRSEFDECYGSLVGVGRNFIAYREGNKVFVCGNYSASDVSCVVFEYDEGFVGFVARDVVFPSDFAIDVALSLKINELKRKHENCPFKKFWKKFNELPVGLTTFDVAGGKLYIHKGKDSNYLTVYFDADECRLYVGGSIIKAFTSFVRAVKGRKPTNLDDFSSLSPVMQEVYEDMIKSAGLEYVLNMYKLIK